VTAADRGPREATIRCRWLVPISGPPVENAWVRLSRGRISAMGRGRPSGVVHDPGDAVILPGLVNAHTHLEFSSLPQPLDATGGLPAWIERIVALRRAAPDPAQASRHRVADVADAVARGLEESAADGVTTIGEIATCVAPLILDRLGMGGPRVRVFREALGLSAGSAAATAATAARDLDLLEHRGIAAGLSPHAPYSVSSTLGRRIVEMARRHRLPVAMHVAESDEEPTLTSTGQGPFREVLERLGAWPASEPALLSAAEWFSELARAARGIVVHGTWLDADEAAFVRLARHRHRLAVVVCPRTNQSLSGRLPPIARLQAAGIRVGIGTDSRASSPDLSLRSECRALVDAGVVSPAEALMMATAQGAWALGFERCGRIAPGCAADLVVLRPAAARAEPCAAALDPDTRVVATLRAGRIIAGTLSA
jgi:cytosine/adenosine deaminase-related metal-dependent hydrolase